MTEQGRTKTPEEIDQDRQIDELHIRLYGNNEVSAEEIERLVEILKNQRQHFAFDVVFAATESGLTTDEVMDSLGLDKSEPRGFGELKTKALRAYCRFFREAGYSEQLPGILKSNILPADILAGELGEYTSAIELAKTGVDLTYDLYRNFPRFSEETT